MGDSKTKRCAWCRRRFGPRVFPSGRVEWAAQFARRNCCSNVCDNRCRWARAEYNAPTRFWSKVKKGKGCWLWTGPRLQRSGYGAFWFRRRQRPAHTVAWLFASGPVPAGLCVCHRCDNRQCVRPSHLFLGTKKDNSEDMVKKGRSLRGALNPDAKLTDREVLKIRFRYAAGGVTQVELGREFGVTQSAVSLIVRKKKWRHLR